MSKNKTSQGLNQWTLDEKPRMEEFNEDNRIADKAIAAVNRRLPADDRIELRSTGESSSPRIYYRDKSGNLVVSTFADVSNSFMYVRLTKDGGYLDYLFEPTRLRVNVDSAIDIGHPQRKFKDIYNKNGVIQTCDETTKQNIKEVDPQVSLDFLTYLGMPSTFEYIDGTSGRAHWGYTAQQVKAAMDRAGLSDTDFAGWINSPLEDEEGNPTGEHLQGLRYDELVNATLFPAALHLMERAEVLERRVELLEQHLND